MSTNIPLHMLPPSTQATAIMDNAKDGPSKYKDFAVLHYRPEQRKFTSSPSALQQRSQHHLERGMARSQRSNAPSASSSLSLLSSPIPLQPRSIMFHPKASSPAPHGPPSSPPLSPPPMLSPSQRSATDNLDTDDEAPPAPALSPLAQHIGKVAQPLLCQLAAAAIAQNAPELDTLGDFQRQIQLIDLNRKTTRAALEKVVLEWARELKQRGGVEGEFVEVCRAAEEFQRFKFARLAFIEERIQREAANASDDEADVESEDDQDGFVGSFPSSEPRDDLNDADDDDSDSDRESHIPHLRPPRRRGLCRKSTTTCTRKQSTVLTHYAPNVYADTSIPCHLKYFVQGRYQHLTLPQPPTAFSNFTSASTTNSSSAIPADTPTITTLTVDQAARFPLRTPNRHTGGVDELDLPPDLAAMEDWESRFWVCRLNDWHAAQLHRRTLQPARHVRHKWNKNEKDWLKGWVQRRAIAAAAAAAAATHINDEGKEEVDQVDKAKAKEWESEGDVDTALTRDWNAYAVTPDGWRKGLRRRDRVILREARKKLCANVG